MKIVVGLGNPGKRYVGTRHNVGYAVVNVLAKSPTAGSFQLENRFDAEIAELREDPERVFLVKPVTFMNLSGRCVRGVLDFYQRPIEDLLVICDDFNLPLGKLRARARGTHGGHNGLRDIQAHVGSTEYARLRLGVGAPEGEDAADYVLDRFRLAELRVMDDAILRAAQAAMTWVQQGIEECMNRYNANT